MEGSWATSRLLLLTLLLSASSTQPELCDGENLTMNLISPNVFEGWVTICEKDVKHDPRWDPIPAGAS